MVEIRSFRDILEKRFTGAFPCQQTFIIKEVQEDREELLPLSNGWTIAKLFHSSLEFFHSLLVVCLTVREVKVRQMPPKPFRERAKKMSADRTGKKKKGNEELMAAAGPSEALCFCHHTNQLVPYLDTYRYCSDFVFKTS